MARLPSAVLRVGQLEYDVVHGRFNLQGQGLQLTAQEYKILAFFHAPPRQAAQPLGNQRKRLRP